MGKRVRMLLILLVGYLVFIAATFLADAFYPYRTIRLEDQRMMVFGLVVVFPLLGLILLGSWLKDKWTAAGPAVRRQDRAVDPFPPSSRDQQNH